MSEVSEKTVAYWANNLAVSQAGESRRLNFWDVHSALERQMLIAFPELDTVDLPAAQLLRTCAPNKKIANAISIGSGSGHKEMTFSGADLLSTSRLWRWFLS